MNLRNYISSLFKPTEKRMDAASELALALAGYAGGSHRYLVPVPAPTNALRNSVVNSCVKLLSETPSTLPLRLVDRQTKRDVTNHPAAMLLETPNPEQTLVEFLEMMLCNYFTHGNCYAEKVTERGRIVALYPMAAARTVVIRKDGRLFYEYVPDGNKSYVLNGPDVMHLRMFGLDDLTGTSPIWAAEKAISLSLTQEEAAIQTFADGARPDYIITLPPEKLMDRLEEITEGALEADKKTIQGQIQGAQTRRGMFVPFGYSVTPYSSNHQQAQFNETRDFQATEIARIWGVPLSLLNVLSEGQSVTEEDRLTFFELIRRVVTKIEKRLERDLLSDADRQRYQFKFNLRALLRSNPTAQADYFVRMWQIGQFTNNVINEIEDFPLSTDPRADQYFYPVNMTTENIQGATQPTNPADGGVSETAPQKNSSHQEPQTRAFTLTDVQTRSLEKRQTASNMAMPLFKAAVERIVRKEQATVMKDAKSIMGTRSADNLEDRIRQLYAGELRRFIEDNVTDPVEALFQEIVRTMGEELETGFDEGELRNIVRRYVEIYVRDYVDSSVGQLITVIRNAEDSSTIVGDLNQRFVEWIEGTSEETPSRAEKEATQESRKGANVFAKALYVLAGITTLRWVTNSPCEICRPFAGMTFSAKARIHVPPIHRKCSCFITSA